MRRGLLGLSALVLVAACASRSEPRSAPSRAAEAHRACGGCHAAAEDGWRRSMHHTSFSNRAFQIALREDPIAFCADCHAPRRRDLNATEAAELGVDCPSCHLNAAAHEREARAGAPRTTAMTTAPCASCHELSSPIAATMLQTTATEHRASAYADLDCVDCHMRARGGARDHETSVRGNVGLLSSALDCSASETNGNVVVSLRSRGVGHKFPTGDLFRALLVRAWIEAPDGRILSEREASLHRDWDTVRRVPGGLATTDTRLDETPMQLSLPAPDVVVPGAVLRVQVDYARGATARGDHFTAFSTLRIGDWATPLR